MVLSPVARVYVDEHSYDSPSGWIVTSKSTVIHRVSAKASSIASNSVSSSSDVLSNSVVIVISTMKGFPTSKVNSTNSLFWRFSISVFSIISANAALSVSACSLTVARLSIFAAQPAIRQHMFLLSDQDAFTGVLAGSVRSDTPLPTELSPNRIDFLVFQLPDCCG